MQTLIVILVTFFAGMGAGLGTGFAGMSAAAVISPMLITFLGMDPYMAVGIALSSDVLASAGFRGLADPAAALEGAVGEIPCPVCGRPLERGEWVEQNGEKRIAMAACPEHGRFFVRLKLWRTGKTFSARRTLCRPDEQIDAFYREKASRARQRAEKRCADGAAGEQAGEN